VFRLREEDVPCSCGPLTTCAAFVEVFEPEAEGRCADPFAECQDVGDVESFCDLFCGS
jgi:hypothetical protein